MIFLLILLADLPSATCTALAQAKKLLRAGGIPAAPSRQQCLGKLVVPFGQYLNAPFHCLVENDVGYIK